MSRALPAPVPFADAEAAGASYEGLVSHPFPTCFACGTARDPADALCLRTGPLPGAEPLRAAAWTPAESTPELVWAALDCPGAWASGIAGREMVLGTMTARVHALPAVGEPHVVMAWPRGHSGRKFLSATCAVRRRRPAARAGRGDLAGRGRGVRPAGVTQTMG